MPSNVGSYFSARSCFTRHSTRVPVAHPRPTLTSAQLYNRKPSPFHAPLAFKPSELPDGTFGLTQEQLTIFVNSAEWSLSSSASNDPVLHFVLFVPSLNRSPPRILNPDNTPSSSNALSLSDLETVFKSFAAQLLILLGAPRLPPNVARSPTETAILTDWQLDALMRRRALENAERAKDTLHSIVKLMDGILLVKTFGMTWSML
ncbi:phosphatidylinositol-glycan biosynthesis class S protein-domain-containing protein [Amanita rubescens]|nr:phosphatidylinositol-glycan biosynthesis class S protein-domain-containing protein [Amanita rubescens]